MIINLNDLDYGISNTDYHSLKSKFLSIVYKIFYRKMSNHFIKNIFIYIRKKIPKTNNNKTFRYKFINSGKNVQNIYKSINNIICVNYPTTYEIDNVIIESNISVICKNKNKYVLYLFYCEDRKEIFNKTINIDLLTCIHTFYDDFSHSNFDVIIVNLSTAKKKLYKNVYKMKDNLYIRAHKDIKKLCLKQN